MTVLEYTEKHQAMLEKFGKTLIEVQGLSSDKRDSFIAENLLPYVCGDGTSEEEDTAEDLITMITAWEAGQTCEVINTQKDDAY